jgi:hypothetical protein
MLIESAEKKKRNWMNNKIKHIEKANNKNQIRIMFKEARCYNIQHLALPILRKDERSNILSEYGDTLQRWKQ